MVELQRSRRPDLIRAWDRSGLIGFAAAKFGVSRNDMVSRSTNNDLYSEWRRNIDRRGATREVIVGNNRSFQSILSRKWSRRCSIRQSGNNSLGMDTHYLLLPLPFRRRTIHRVLQDFPSPGRVPHH